jgi:dihydropteroate synthase
VITLAALARVQAAYGDSWSHDISPVAVGDLSIGDDAPVLMGTVNLSRDSSYRESVATGTSSALRKARIQIAQGAGIVDLGAESSNVGTVRVSSRDQIASLVPVIEELADETVVSVETYEPPVVEACLDAGATILNMTGREHEDEMLTLAAKYDAAVVLCFGEADNIREISDLDLSGDPMPLLVDHFGARLERARSLGATRLIIDPGMGFYYGNLVDPIPRARHQAKVLTQGFRLRSLGAPICNAMPHAFDLFEDEFRTAEGFFAIWAALGSTHVLRTHEVSRVKAVLDSLAALAVD